MPPYKPRVLEDLNRLAELSRITNNKVVLISKSNYYTNQIDLTLNYITAKSYDYPSVKQIQSKVHIDLPDGYPTKPIFPPKITITTPIFHPNIHPSGLICIGTWVTTEFLDLLVKRVIRIICFDPQYVNVRSAANPKAANWYKEIIKKNPRIFPTEDLKDAFIEKSSKPKIIFKPLG